MPVADATPSPDEVNSPVLSPGADKDLVQEILLGLESVEKSDTIDIGGTL